MGGKAKKKKLECRKYTVGVYYLVQSIKDLLNYAELRKLRTKNYIKLSTIPCCFMILFPLVEYVKQILFITNH